MNTEEKMIKYTNNKIKKEEKINISNEFDDDFDYQNIMEMTDEGKSNDIKKLPNVFGYIHSKGQLEKQIQNQNQTQKEEDGNHCILF